ncbi:MAG: hypothetical protein WC757_04905, partial [Candidatus Paceibacterota bacterium]
MNTAATTETDDRSAAYQEAAIELGKGIALGLVPFLGQAIDAYDTLESILALYNAKKADDKENAQFDLVLALVGWIPGPGDGVKKSLRLVNKNPERFAPVLFDLLRFVLQECGVQTSPEALLEETFNAGKLTGVLNEAKKGVEDFPGFKALPLELQTTVTLLLAQAANNLPAMVGIVEKRLLKWKKVQRNSSANAHARGKDKRNLPEAKDGNTAKDGANRSTHARSDSSNNSQLATLAAQNLNQLLGISGEHIADYICLETFKWGKGWKSHDDGEGGDWTGAKPNKDTPGKLSRRGKLFRLADGANGTGIDSVWRASGNNEGKPYAIVEAKASKQEDAPKFHRNKGWKPSINSKLGDNSRAAKKRNLKDGVKSRLADEIVTDTVQLIEPLDEDDKPSVSKKAGGKAGNKPTRSQRSANTRTKQSDKTPQDQAKDKGIPGGKNEIFVQMSHEWIRKNINSAVSDEVSDVITLKRNKVYSRHLFFSPYYHISGSPKAHMEAKLANQPPSAHEKHNAFHYGENGVQGVKAAVNKRKAKLRKEFGKSHPNL